MRRHPLARYFASAFSLLAALAFTSCKTVNTSGVASSENAKNTAASGTAGKNRAPELRALFNSSLSAPNADEVAKAGNSKIWNCEFHAAGLASKVVEAATFKFRRGTGGRVIAMADEGDGKSSNFAEFEPRGKDWKGVATLPLYARLGSDQHILLETVQSKKVGTAYQASLSDPAGWATWYGECR